MVSIGAVKRAIRAAGAEYRVAGIESMPLGWEKTPGDQVAARAAAEAPPGTALDSYPWAKSWGTFLNAIRDKDDRQGARKAITAAMASRPRNAMGERVPSEGGFLVPWRLTESVLNYMTAGIIRPRAMPVTMDALRVTLPVLDNPTAASGAQVLGGLVFSMVEEGQSFTATVPNFGRAALEARKVGAYMTSVPNELLADATPFTESFLPQVIARGLDWYVDDLCIANGTGVGEPQALVNSPAAVAVTRATSDAVVLADLVAIVKALHPQAMKTATWLVSKSANDQILDLYYAAAGQVWNGSELVSAQMPIAPPEWYTPGSGGSGPSMLGLEVEVNDHQAAVGSTGDVMLCDIGQYLLGSLEWLTIEVSSKGSGFVSDTSNIRVRSRIDGRFWPQQPFTTQTSQEVSPLVVLH
jgi:HK97 family phage major capsid protein